MEYAKIYVCEVWTLLSWNAYGVCSQKQEISYIEKVWLFYGARICFSKNYHFNECQLHGEGIHIRGISLVEDKVHQTTTLHFASAGQGLPLFPELCVEKFLLVLYLLLGAGL